MKTKSIIGALVVIALSFAACEKESFQPNAITDFGAAETINDASPSNTSLPADRANGGGSHVPAIRPVTIHNLESRLDQSFIFNLKGQLEWIKKSNGEATHLFYDDRLRLVKAEIMNAPARGIEILKFSYNGRNQKPYAIEVFSQVAGRQFLLSKNIQLTYDALGRKIQEAEYNFVLDSTDPDVAPDPDRLMNIAYDDAGNISEIIEKTKSGAMKTLRFKNFLSVGLAESLVPVLQLLPHGFVPNKVPGVVMEITSESVKTMELTAVANRNNMAEKISKKERGIVSDYIKVDYTTVH